jgi:hypothetical protein
MNVTLIILTDFGSCEHGNEPSGPIKGEEFDSVNYCQLKKNDSTHYNSVILICYLHKYLNFSTVSKDLLSYILLYSGDKILNYI